jgi:site-specific DNA-methyltransferase (adenine-specific)
MIGLEKNRRERKNRSAVTKPILETPLGKLFEADCLAVLPTLKANVADVIFADPPFNLGKNYASKMDDSLAEKRYLQWCYEWIDECIRVLKPGGSFFLYNLPKWNVFLGAHMSKTLTFRHWISVDIKFSLPIPGRLYPSHYSLLYYCKGKRPAIFHPDRLPIPCCRNCGGELKDYGGYKDKMNPRGVNLSDVWSDIPPVRHKRYKNRSGNELSLKLLDRILAIASNADSVILDPFGGAGTTFVAAELLNRRWIGVELDCSAILKRFELLEKDRCYLDEIQKNKNLLFTGADLKRRAQNGKPLSPRYRIPTSSCVGVAAKSKSRH